MNRSRNYGQEYNSEHQLLFFHHRLSKVNILLLNSSYLKKKNQGEKHLNLKCRYKNEEQMTQKECPIQKNARFIRTLLLIRPKTAGKQNHVQIYWRPWELAVISCKNLQNLIKAAFVEKQIYIPNESIQSTRNQKARGGRKQKVTPYISYHHCSVLCLPSCSAKSKRKVFGSENSIVVQVIKAWSTTYQRLWNRKDGKINISQNLISRSMES